jgi:hypothetical protein
MKIYSTALLLSLLLIPNAMGREEERFGSLEKGYSCEGTQVYSKEPMSFLNLKVKGQPVPTYNEIKKKHYLADKINIRYLYGKELYSKIVNNDMPFCFELIRAAYFGSENDVFNVISKKSTKAINELEMYTFNSGIRRINLEYTNEFFDFVNAAEQLIISIDLLENLVSTFGVNNKNLLIEEKLFVLNERLVENVLLLERYFRAGKKHYRRLKTFGFKNTGIIGKVNKKLKKFSRTSQLIDSVYSYKYSDELFSADTYIVY